MVFGNVQAIVIRTFDGNARSAHFGQPIIIKGFEIQFRFDLLAHLLRPRLRAEKSDPDFHALGNVYAHLHRGFGKHERVRWSAIENGGAEIFHQHDLPFG